MPVAKVSSKGQITLPASCRRELGIKPLDRVLVETEDDKIVVRPVPDFFELGGFLGKALAPEEERKRMMKGVARRRKGGR